MTLDQLYIIFGPVLIIIIIIIMIIVIIIIIIMGIYDAPYLSSV